MQTPVRAPAVADAANEPANASPIAASSGAGSPAGGATTPTTAVTKPRAKQQHGVQFPLQSHQLIRWAANDEALCKYVGPNPVKSIAGFLQACVASFGVRRRDDGACEHSLDPQYNMFEKQRAQHAAAQADAKTQVDAANQRTAAALDKAEELRLAGEHERERAAGAAQQQRDRAAQLRGGASAADARKQAEEVEKLKAELERESGRANEAEAELVNLRVELETCRAARNAAPSRTEQQATGRQQHRQQQQQAEAQAEEARTDAAACAEKNTQLKSQLLAEQQRRGKLASQVETLSSRLEPPQKDALHSARLQSRREQGKIAELQHARQTIAEQRAEIYTLKETQPAGRGVQQQQQSCPWSGSSQHHYIKSIRTTAAHDGHYLSRTLEFMRRLVDESNCSFESAATCNALALATHIGDVPIAHLTNPEAYRRAFVRLGLLDNEAEAAVNLVYKGPVCIAQDGGGGSLMMAYGKWDYERNRPEARPLAAADLLRDQTATHGVSLLQREMTKMGIKPERVVASCSDGTTHAVQESEGNMAAAHEAAQTAGHRVDKDQLGKAELCCIHGKALEEVNGFEAAFPREFVVNAARLLWEIVGSPIQSGGRPKEYRKYWIERDRRGIRTPSLPIWSQTPSPTELRS